MNTLKSGKRSESYLEKSKESQGKIDSILSILDGMTVKEAKSVLITAGIELQNSCYFKSSISPLSSSIE